MDCLVNSEYCTNWFLAMLPTPTKTVLFLIQALWLELIPIVVMLDINPVVDCVVFLCVWVSVFCLYLIFPHFSCTLYVCTLYTGIVYSVYYLRQGGKACHVCLFVCLSAGLLKKLLNWFWHSLVERWHVGHRRNHPDDVTVTNRWRPQATPQRWICRCGRDSTHTQCHGRTWKSSVVE